MKWTRRGRGAIVAVALLLAAITLAACGSSSDSSTSTSSGASSTSSSTTAAADAGLKDIKQFWSYTGLEHDSGYNQLFEGMMADISKLPGLSPPGTVYDIDYTAQSSKAIELAIAQGYQFFVDSSGMGELITSVCAKHPDVGCLTAADPAKQVPNSRSFWTQSWNFDYIAGAAAGLMTKSNIVGVVGAFKIPVIQGGINPFTLGCQSTNPKCRVRVIYANTYFDPPKEAAIANTLVDAGADVLRNTTDTAATCQTAEKRGVYAITQYYDFQSTCPKSVITSTVWDQTDYLKEQIQSYQKGEFKGGVTDFIPLGNKPGTPHLGTFGPFVPDDVKTKINDLAAKAAEGADGTNLIVGPIKDQSGKLRFKAGEHPTPDFMFRDWNWYVEGVDARE